jgi:hypothetical protein
MSTVRLMPISLGLGAFGHTRDECVNHSTGTQSYRLHDGIGGSIDKGVYQWRDLICGSV